LTDEQKSAPARTAASAEPGAVYSTASKRRYTRRRRVLFAVATPLLGAVLRVMRVTVRVRTRPSDRAADALERLRAHTSAGAACLPCFWHRHLMPGARFLLAEQRHGLRACWLISPSLDAEVPARVAAGLGFAIVRGSGTRTGMRALLALKQAVKTERASAVMTPDGPKGPPERARAGAIKLAQLTGAPIVPVGLAIRGALRLKTWDRLELALPWARVTAVVGAPIDVPADVDAAGIEALRARLERELVELDVEAAR